MENVIRSMACNKIPQSWELNIYEKAMLKLEANKSIEYLYNSLKENDLDSFDEQLKFLIQISKQLKRDSVVKVVNQMNKNGL